MTGEQPEQPRRLDLDDPLLRPLTIAQVTELTGRSKRTIDRWIHDGRLRTVRLQGDPPQDVVVEREALELEREMRRAAHQGRPRPKTGDTAADTVSDTPSIPQVADVDAGG